jgi:hypothetical protein
MYALRSGNKAKLQSHGTEICFGLASSMVLQDWGSTYCFCWWPRVFTFSTSHGNITPLRVIWPYPISNKIWPQFRLLQTVRTITHRHLTLHQSSRAMFLFKVQQSNKTLKNLRLFWCRCVRYGYVNFLCIFLNIFYSQMHSVPYWVNSLTFAADLLCLQLHTVRSPYKVRTSNLCCRLAVPTAAHSRVYVHSTYF